MLISHLIYNLDDFFYRNFFFQTFKIIVDVDIDIDIIALTLYLYGYISVNNIDTSSDDSDGFNDYVTVTVDVLYQ